MAVPAVSLSGLDPLSAVLAAVAGRVARQFAGRNLVIRNRGTVHAVVWARWMGGWDLPAPACHVGTFGWAVDDLHPTRAAVTCKLCHRSTEAIAPAVATAPRQLTLDLDTTTR